MAMVAWLAPFAAQDVAAQRALGFKGGLTLASADIKDLEGTFDTDNRTGWGAGAFLTLGSGALSIQPELNFLDLGFDVTLGPGVSPEVKLRYLAPVVLLRLGLPLVVVRPGVFGGVGLGIELDCTIDDVACEDFAPVQLETGATDPTGVFGADVDINLGSVSLRGDARYAIGLSDIEEASDIWTEVRNRAWQVSAGLAFRF
jgi:hypothetical protein